MANTRRALFLSVVSIFLCVVMLAGTTFAWFTDSVESTGNIIKTGKLKIDLIHTDAKGISYSFKDASNADHKIFNYQLWEPGYLQYDKFVLENHGDLHFNYQLALIASDTITALADVIDVYYIEATPASVTRESFTDAYKLGTLSSILANGGILIKGDTNSFGDAINDGVKDTIFTSYIALKMQESAGNDYQNMPLFTDANNNTAGFSVKLDAIQYTYENDSFDNQYDADADQPLPVAVDSSTPSEEIAELFASGTPMIVNEDITFSHASKELEVNGNVTISSPNNSTITIPKTMLFTGDGTVTVKSGKLETPQELCVSGNTTLVINGGVHEFGAFSATSNGSIIVNGGTLNCRGTYGGVLGISFGETGSLVINDGIINLYQPINLNANRCDNAYVEINGGEINLLNGADKLVAVRNIMAKDRESGVLRGSSVKITGGIFTTTYEMDSSGDANALIRNEDGTADTNRVLVSNTYNGQPDYNCVVTGGTFYGSWQRSDNNRLGTGPVVENSIAGFVPDGYTITGDEVNGYVVA